MNEINLLRLQALEDENRRLRAALAEAAGEAPAVLVSMPPSSDDGMRARAGATSADLAAGSYDEALRARNHARSGNELLTRSDEWLRLAQEAVGIGGFSLDLGANVLTVSHKFCEIFGLPQRERWKPEDIERMSMTDPLRRPSTRDERNGGTMALDTEYPILRGSDMQLRWISRRARYVYDDGGRRVGILGTVQDVTDRKRAELRQEAVLRLGDQLRMLDTASAVYALGTDVMGRTLELIRAVYLGVDERRALAVHLSEWTARADVARLDQDLPLSLFRGLVSELRTGVSLIIHDVWTDTRTRDHAEEWTSVGVRSALLLPVVERGELVSIVLLHSGYLRQWTASDTAFARHAVDRVHAAMKRLAAETTLRETELRLRLSLEAAAIGTWEYRAQGGRLYVDERFRRIAALPADAYGLDVLIDAFDVPYREMVRGAVDAALRGEEGGRVAVEARLGGNLSEARWVQFTGGRLVDADGAVRLTGVLRDITADVRAAELLREKADQAMSQRQILIDILQCTPDMIAAVGPDFRFLTFNPAYHADFERSFHEAPQVGASLPDFLRRLAPDDAHVHLELWSRALAGEALSVTRSFRRPGGGARTVELRHTPLFDARGARVGAVQWARDVTERTETEKRLADAEAALRQSQKMEAIGLLTSGIAHDFNNLLHGMVTALSIIKRTLARQGGSGLERYADMATSSAHRAAALTHRLLAFSRRQPLDPKPVDMNALVASMEELLQRTFGSNVRLEVSLAADLRLTHCDANQLENALLNLVVNARDAMPDGGTLRIGTANASVTDTEAAELPDLAPGDYVCLTVSDEGIGMTEDVLAHAFDPFFTTKPRGQGTGLGLSMIYGFVKQSGGHIHVDTSPGRGATFRIYLPAYVGTVAPVGEDTPPPVATRAGNGYVVQVVEDDDIIRTLTAEALEGAGYTVLRAADGSAGLASIDAAERLDALVTDVGLPGLNGRQLADAARERTPDLPVLFMTGYAESTVITPDALGSGMEMIIKPFAMERLLARVAALIAQRGYRDAK